MKLGRTFWEHASFGERPRVNYVRSARGDKERSLTFIERTLREREGIVLF